MPHLETDLKLDFNDVLIRPKRTTLKSRAEVDLECEYTFPHSKQTYTGVPIMASNMDSVGTLGMAQVLAKHNLFTSIYEHCPKEEWVKLAEGQTNGLNIWSKIALSTGMHDAQFAHTLSILEAVPQLQYVLLDVANGHMEKFVDFVRRAREALPRHTLIAGQVGTPETAEELLLNGADIVKVGIGGGSVCTTRKMTGIGYPQLSSVLECAEIAHDFGGYIISDGGCTCPGDVAKAFAAGADFVMLGGMFAGHDQTAGPVIEKNGRKYKLFYGICSKTSMEKFDGGVASYRAPEGKTVEVPYRGDVENTIRGILGGLRSTCTYTGAKKLQDLSKVATLVRVTNQGNNVFERFEMYE